MVRRRARVTGTVQGVGFRPFVYRRAVQLGLTGFVRNDAAGVLIELEGPAAAVDELDRLLRDDAPPLARVTGVETTALRPQGSTAFLIVASSAEGQRSAPVSVDTATCAECLAEVDDPDDRRYRYPFTNCTNCGPRYTIVERVPYDRPATTMAAFTMCRECQDEYDDPADRRFHAQPNACAACGPTLRFCDRHGAVLAKGDEAIDAAAAALTAGRVLAVKGIGGFHLAADATDEAAVGELRRRKARDDKPFAVMVADLDAARRFCELSPVALDALASPRRPIVLAPRLVPAPRHGASRDARPIASSVAPGLAELGLMLAYSPLHHLLLGRVGRPLVMTSGNHSDEPIAHTDDDAFARLAPLVDGVLTHDRPIHIRCDDSVVRARGDGVTVLRRSRGYAPEPLRLAAPARRRVLAVGAELKSTVAVASGGAIVVSHHIGDLEHLATYRSFLQAIDHVCHLGAVVPEVVAHDLHPEYLSTKLALDLTRGGDIDPYPIQHHHAHVASCLAEHARTEPVLGLAFDGLGYGPDGTLWGGEFLVADFNGYERVGHLAPIALPGGAAAVREPWRMAVAWSQRAAGSEAALALGRELVGEERAAAVLDLVERERGLTTSSMGRLFDALAALVGLRTAVSYEAQAAIEFEALAHTVDPADAPRYEMAAQRLGGLLVVDPAPLVATVLDERRAGTAPGLIAAGCHRAIASAAVRAAVELAAERGLATIALSGGAFQNARLGMLVADGLRAEGLEVLVHRLVPPNDGGISVGQAAIAALGDRPRP